MSRAKGCLILALQFIGAWIVFGVFIIAILFLDAPIRHNVILPIRQALNTWEDYWGRP